MSTPDVTETELLEMAARAASAWPEVTAPPVLHAWRENVVFRVETTLGPHALRLHRPGYHDDASLASELAWMGALAAGGVDVPRPLPLPDGSHLQMGPRRASMLSWRAGRVFGINGQPLEIGARETRLRILRSLGLALARVHLISDAWTPPAGFTRPAWDFDGLVGEQPFWGRFWDAKLISQSDRDLLARLRAHARSILAQKPRDIGLIHADLVRENILLDGEDVCLIDFDDSGWGYRGFDLATAMRSLFAEPDFADLWAALLQGYGELRPLPDPEILPLLLVLRAATYISWMEDRLDTPGMEAKLKPYRKTCMDLLAVHLPHLLV